MARRAAGVLRCALPPGRARAFVGVPSWAAAFGNVVTFAQF